MKRILAILCLLLVSVAAFATRPYVPPPCPGTPTGYYVSGKQLFSPLDTPVVLHGVNDNHWDQVAAAKTGIPLTGANAVRLEVDFAQTAATNQAAVDPLLKAGLVTIIGNWKGTCKVDSPTLTAIVDTWVAQAPTWTQAKYQSTLLINIANEWGPANNVVWRDQYLAAIARMRAAGYMQPLVIDSGNCGQDVADVVTYGPALLAADPQHNVLFDVHVYGYFAAPALKSWQQDFNKAMTALGATGLPVLIGEYGPGLNVGSSPTLITPEQVLAASKAQGFVGDMAWSYNDNNLAGCKTADTGWFGMTTYCATFTGKPTDLTAFGRKMVPLLRSMNGMPALQSLAPAAAFNATFAPSATLPGQQ